RETHTSVETQKLHYNYRSKLQLQVPTTSPNNNYNSALLCNADECPDMCVCVCVVVCVCVCVCVCVGVDCVVRVYGMQYGATVTRGRGTVRGGQSPDEKFTANIPANKLVKWKQSLQRFPVSSKLSNSEQTQMGFIFLFLSLSPSLSLSLCLCVCFRSTFLSSDPLFIWGGVHYPHTSE